MADTGSLLGISDLSVLCDSATHTGSLSKITTQFTSLSTTKAEQTHQNTKVRKCVRRNVDSKGVVLHLKIADTDLKTVSSTEPYRQDLEGSTAITEKKKKKPEETKLPTCFQHSLKVDARGHQQRSCFLQQLEDKSIGNSSLSAIWHRHSEGTE